MLHRLLAGVSRLLRVGLARAQGRIHSLPASTPGAGAAAGPSIDLTSTPSPYVQPDHTTCGSATLVMARMINHAEYARTLLDAPPSEHHPDVGAHFRADVLAMHELTNTGRDETGRWQLPWPKDLGTQPWAVARRMSEPGGCGVTGSRYRVRIADPARLDGDLDAIGAAIAAGHCVPIFVGDEVCPRHVALVIDAGTAQFGCYDPSVGLRVSIDRAAVRAGAMDVAGWSQLWVTVLPVANPPAA